MVWLDTPPQFNVFNYLATGLSKNKNSKNFKAAQHEWKTMNKGQCLERCFTFNSDSEYFGSPRRTIHFYSQPICDK